MKNRAVLARINAMRKKKKAPKKVAKKPKVEGQIIAKDPETGKVVHTFDSFDAASAAEFKVTNIKSALKTGNKYKGYLWEVKE